jgi:GNAT superfamily N-acetyltransferase
VDVEREYIVVDRDGSEAGSLRLAVCPDYEALNKEMPFSNLEGWAAFQGHSSPASCGFSFFQRQFPITDIYPVAILEDIEIQRNKRRMGIGRRSIVAFRAIAQEYKCRLGLLRIGTQGDEIETGLEWRKRFYERDGWVRLEAPPIRELLPTWMYHLLPPLFSAELEMRKCLIDKPPDIHAMDPT